MRLILASLALYGALSAAMPVQAAVQTSIGAGSAVDEVQAQADFENPAALWNPYVEGGMSFTRSGLSENNNGCGFAGCQGSPGLAVFSGNYMYGYGVGFFSIQALDGQDFEAIEFQVGSGRPIEPFDIYWAIYDDGVEVETGVISDLAFGSVIGFRDSNGFDEIRFANSHWTTAFDSVRAQFSSVAPVPEPTSTALLLAAGGVLSCMRRRRRPS